MKRYKEFGNIYSFLLNAKWVDKKNEDYHTINSFLSFVKMKSMSYTGISEKYFLEYLCELIIKFNKRSTNYYDFMLKMINFRRVAETTRC